MSDLQPKPSQEQAQHALDQLCDFLATELASDGCAPRIFRHKERGVFYQLLREETGAPTKPRYVVQALRKDGDEHSFVAAGEMRYTFQSGQLLKAKPHMEDDFFTARWPAWMKPADDLSKPELLEDISDSSVVKEW